MIYRHYWKIIRLFIFVEYQIFNVLLRVFLIISFICILILSNLTFIKIFIQIEDWNIGFLIFTLFLAPLLSFSLYLSLSLSLPLSLSLSIYLSVMVCVCLFISLTNHNKTCKPLFNPHIFVFFSLFLFLTLFHFSLYFKEVQILL